jgi:PAS domain S-box-containing protein
MLQVEAEARKLGAPETFFNRCHAFIHDVLKEEERLAKAHEAEKSIWKSLFDQAPVGLVIYDADGRYNEVNQKFCEMTGLPREVLLDPAFDWTTIFAEKLDQAFAGLQQVVATGEPLSHALVITGKTQRRDVLSIISPLSSKDQRGRPLLCTWHQDITALKQKERDLDE